MGLNKQGNGFEWAECRKWAEVYILNGLNLFRTYIVGFP